MMRKVGRNDPCPCGSGKKYKKCHLEVDSKPLPREVFEHFEMVQAEQSRLEQAGIRMNFVQPIIFKGRKVWALGSRIYPDRPPRETFHEFIIEVLRQTLGKEWWEEQRVASNKHFLMICFESFYKFKLANALPEHLTADGLWSVTPEGLTKYLLSLAFDVFSLLHSLNLPSPLLGRLRHWNEFQGARYEIAIAAVFARLNYKVTFLDEVTSRGESHCDLLVTDKETGGTYIVEAKSRRRKGVLHEPGTADELQAAKGDVVRLFHDALRQSRPDKPYLIFIDLNAPFSGSLEAINRGWREDIREMLRNEPVPSSDNPSQFTGLYVTNMAYHYDAGPSVSPNEILEIQAGLPKHPIQDPNLFEMIGRALANYGTIPSFDVNGILGSEELSEASTSGGASKSES